MSAFSAAAQDEDGDIIKNLQARVADLEAQLYAVGAGGVGSPVARQDHPEQHLDMVPKGWKLVPVEPTEEMLHAGNSAIENWGVDANGSSTYRAMLAAAPELLEFAEEVRRTGDTRLASMAIAVIAKAIGEAK